MCFSVTADLVLRGLTWSARIICRPISKKFGVGRSSPFLSARRAGPKPGYRVALLTRGTIPMEIGPLHVVATPEHISEIDRLGQEIAELSAHLDAATAHLLDLIREFDTRGGWNTGFPSCAHWLSWRVGIGL